jgi:hypothetical protein
MIKRILVMLAILVMLVTIFTNAQVKIQRATVPNFDNGTILIDTTGTKIKNCATYRIVDGVRVEPPLGYNQKKKNLQLLSKWKNSIK